MFSSFNVQRRSRGDLDTITSVEAVHENRSDSSMLHRIHRLRGTCSGDRTSVPAQDGSKVSSGERLPEVGERSEH